MTPIIMSYNDFLSQLPKIRDLINKTTTLYPIDAHFLCGECDDVVLEPEKCAECERVFCKGCIEGGCPTCVGERAVELSRFERISLGKVEF